MSKRYLTGGGKDLKNLNNSNSYLSKIFDLVKIRKILSEKNGIPSNRCNLTPLAEALRKLTFGIYERKASAACYFGKYSLAAVCRKIAKIVSDAQGKPSDRCTEKYCSPGSMYPGTEKNTARSGSLPSRCPLDRCARNIASGCRLVNEILTFAAYDRIGGAEPRAQKGSGTSVFGLFIYQTVCRKISKIVSGAQGIPSDGCNSQKIPDATSRCLSDRCTEKCCSPGSMYPGTEKNTARSGSLPSRCLRAANCGSILIEFAVCTPILIILLFYIHDLVRIKRYYSQTEFVGQQMANILQNLAKKRAAEGKTISLLDIKHAASLAYLTIYPGTTMHSTKSGSEWHAFFHEPRCYIYFVKGKSGGKASTVWVAFARSGPKTSPGAWNNGTYTADRSASTIRWGTDVDPSSIYPTLKVEEGKYKVLIETQLFFEKPYQLGPNGEEASSAREVFGLRLVNPQPKDPYKTAYFPSVIIFTPNSGFSENAPSAS